jgi:BirA family biotin operon repressor/biotin-[acetyl-CoA-carboxylase] ligase
MHKFGYWLLVTDSLNFSMNDQIRIIGSHLYMMDEIDSTNTELLKYVDQYEHGAVLCARKQTEGRGRHQRNWASQDGGLYFSVLLKDQHNLKNVYPFVLLTALSVVRCIQSCASRGIAIKWPNDIYINHRKVCGILAESQTRGKNTNVVIGVGINVNNPVSKLSGLRHPAVSLKECRGESIDLDTLLKRILDELNMLYAGFLDHEFSSYLPELNRLLYSKDQPIELTVGSDRRMITPLAFTKDASLLCRENGKETTVFIGEM